VPSERCLIEEQSIEYMDGGVVCSDVVRGDLRSPIHNILSTAPQLSISQEALGTLLVDGNINAETCRSYDT
jgi:hypothetical protein